MGHSSFHSKHLVTPWMDPAPLLLHYCWKNKHFCVPPEGREEFCWEFLGCELLPQCSVWMRTCTELLIQTEAQVAANTFQTENFKLVQSPKKEHFPNSGYIKMQGNCVSECFSLVLRWAWPNFPGKCRLPKLLMAVTQQNVEITSTWERVSE